MTIIIINGKTKEVKNLGWLLRNWQQVSKLGFNVGAKDFFDNYLSARLKNGGVYMTDFADFGIAFNFVNRPVFKGLEFRIREFDKEHNGNFYSFIIGDEKYNQLLKLWKSGHNPNKMWENIPEKQHLIPKPFIQQVFSPENLSKEQRSI